MAFPRLRLAVFLNGCYWHRCPACSLPAPKANADFWRQKLEANVQRDVDVGIRLDKLGWTVITIWEHEIRTDPRPKARELALLVRAYRTDLRRVRA